MITIIDTNILIYSVDQSSPFHTEAEEWLNVAFARGDALGIPWVTALAFLRVLTYSSALKQPFTMDEVSVKLDELLSQSNVELIHPSNAHWRLFKELLIENHVSGRFVSDTHLAALCFEHNAQLCTYDRGFRRFKGLKIIDPIKSH